LLVSGFFHGIFLSDLADDLIREEGSFYAPFGERKAHMMVKSRQKDL
jgi:hypothetical protein